MHMTNTIDWMRATAEWMAIERPDIYTPERAMLDLDNWMEYLRKVGSGSCATAGFVLEYSHDDGMESFSLARVVSTLDIFPEENAVNAFSWTDNSGTMTRGVDLPSVSSMDIDWPLTDED
jgi:hypothetical protein